MNNFDASRDYAFAIRARHATRSTFVEMRQGRSTLMLIERLDTSRQHKYTGIDSQAPVELLNEGVLANPG
jgi:hypothetical protein